MPTEHMAGGGSLAGRGRGAGGRRAGPGRVAALVLLAGLLAGSTFFFLPGGAAHSPAVAGSERGPATAAPSSPRVAASADVAASPAPATATPANASVFNPPCYTITKTACVRIASAAMPDVVPTGSNHASSVEPTATQNLEFLVYSETNLMYSTTNVVTEGYDAPVYLNVTSVLWNGDPYFCYCDGSVWHSNNNTWYVEDTAREFSNASYPYVYDLYIVNRSAGANGVPAGPQFFAGETVYWQVTITTPVSNGSSVFNHTRSVPFSYRISGAWAFSPHPGAVQYGGPNASTADLNVKWTPRAPNWNDTVNVTISTTSADVENLTQIGSATLYIEEVHLGRLVGNATIRSFPIGQYTNAQGVQIVGNNSATASIPNTFAQVPGDEIIFWIVAQDTAKDANDTIIYPQTQYVVNGNGSFSTDIFSDDINVNTTPYEIAHPNIDASTGAIITPTINPGENVSVTVSSTNPATSLFNVLIDYTINYAPLGETQSTILQLGRVNSTAFTGTIPGMPVNATLSFSVQALDYTYHLDESTPYVYYTQSFQNYTTAFLPVNETFFYVYVYNNGSSSYVSGATVQIEGAALAFNTLSLTRFGIAYPNETGNNFAPLVIAANVSYTISVSTPIFQEPGGGDTLTVTLVATNPTFSMNGEHGTLATGSDYYIVQEGSAVFFWLNGTLPQTIHAPPLAAMTTGFGFVASGVLGVVAAGIAAFFLYSWFDRILKRRKAEERRVTL